MMIATKFTEEQIAAATRYAGMTPPTVIDPRIEALVTELIGRVADKWTMLILEVLAEKGTLRFSRLAEAIGGISQKMLTQTLRRWSATGWSIVVSTQSCRRRSNTASPD